MDDALIDADVLAGSGLVCLPAPMMTIEPLDVDLDQLFDDIDAEAVALTSRHAVQIAARSRWADKPVFCVGKSTARLAKEAGMDNILTGPGDGHGLAEMMSQSSYQTIFWPSAVDVGFDLAKPLSEHGINVIRTPVYKAAQTNHLPQAVIAALAAGKVLAVMVHSGRAGVHLAEMMEKYDLLEQMKSISIIAVSTRVGAQCKTGRGHEGWRRIIIAETPRRSAMFDAVIALSKDQDAKIPGAQ